MNDPRLIAISNLLAQYSLGNFNTPEIPMSEKLDEIDSIIGGVNMLGEELEATTVSRDFFVSIYNTVSNFLIVADTSWKIVDINATVIALLGYTETELLGMAIDELIKPDQTAAIKYELELHGNKRSQELNFSRKNGSIIPTESHWSVLHSPTGEASGYLIVADDLTDKKLKEREILLNIMETQERERIRVADDLHDSLGQELAGIRMMLATITNHIDDQKQQTNLNSCIELLDSSLENIRSICFDLVPSALNEGELVMAMRQVIRKLSAQDDVEYIFETPLKKTHLSQQHQIAIYRVFQEFVHNAMKHAQCSEIKIEMNEINGQFILKVSDNGVGFEMGDEKEFSGRGLSTMNSRIKALDGSLRFFSKPGEGTQLIVKFNL